MTDCTNIIAANTTDSLTILAIGATVAAAFTGISGNGKIF
jgi:hypothetical protein